MKLIAVTQRTDTHLKYNETRDSLDQRWATLFHICELTPLLIPNNIEIAKQLIANIKIDGLLLTGGNDSPLRLESESYLFQTALQKKIPTLGICHGMQLIQNHFGINLYPVQNHIHDEQKIRINNKTATVNSYHELGTDQSAHELQVWAKAYDGVVKAIHHRILPIVGIMWHPERCQPYNVRDIQLIQNIFKGLPQCTQLY